MALVNGHNLAFAYGANDIFTNISVSIPHGARIALVSVSARRTAERIARDIRYIELATVSKFNKRFIGSIALGHEPSDVASPEP